MNSFFDFNSGKIHFRINGDGPAVILIHGFLENMNMWLDFEQKLSDYFKVITIDLPGHGKSSNYGRVNTMDFMAESVNTLMDILNINKAVIIGHSMGGYVISAFAQNYQDKLTGFGFFHSHVAADNAEGKINRGRAIKVVEENHKNFISAFIPDLFTPENQIKFSKEISQMQEESRAMEKEGIIAALNGMRERKDGYKLLRTTTLPVLFIIGKEDIRAPMEDLLKQIYLPKRSHILILGKVAHMGFLEAFDETSDFVESFVRNCYSH